MRGSADLNRNNLDCLRLILASIVALFHISALTQLPAFSMLGRYLSPHFAVRSFFVVSGLLIYRSYIRSSSPYSYFNKRVRRIYPAYFTVIALAAVGLVGLSALPAHQYFGLGFWKYLGANLLFLNFLAPSLPGVFTSNPLSPVNGALWTLKIEVAFYISVPLIHYFCTRFGTKRVIATLFVFSCVWKYGFSYLASIQQTHNTGNRIYEHLAVQFPAQLAYFMAGILLLLYFDVLKQHMAAIAAVTVVFFLSDQYITNDILDIFWISGLVFVFGFWKFFGEFAKHGDYSYGIYIVHWPILQVLIALGVTRYGPAVFLPASLMAIGIAAFLMWTFVEQRFLSTSSHYRQFAERRPASEVATSVNVVN